MEGSMLLGKMGGHMLHGVLSVTVRDGDRTLDIPTDGRAYMWSNGAVTVYSDDEIEAWRIVAPHRVVSINGKEHG